MEKLKKTDAEWRNELSEDAYDILRRKGTERPFTGKYLNEKRSGSYVCAGCNAVLFSSDAKYDSHSGWPSFWQPKTPDAIAEKEDRTLGQVRIEALCSQCDGHLGHVFEDGPEPTGLRYCINSISVKFEPK